MKAKILLPLLLCAGAPLYAQTYQGSPTPTLEPPVSNGAAFADGWLFAQDDHGITPTMRRDRLARALALRQEAMELQAKDGGVLSAKHVRYVQRETREILGWPANMSGTLTRRISSSMVRSCPVSQQVSGSSEC